jgi:hypothetical protein
MQIIYNLFENKFAKLYKIFTVKKQINRIFFLVVFGITSNFIFNVILYRKINKLICELKKDKDKYK